MEEDFVNFEIAKLLKERGFNEICLRTYYDDGEMSRIYDEDEGVYNENLLPSIIAAPTHQMAMKWLREEYGIIITIDFDEYELTSDNKKVGYGWNIQKIENPTEYFKISTMAYDTYEEAIEASIKFCLKNLI